MLLALKSEEVKKELGLSNIQLPKHIFKVPAFGIIRKTLNFTAQKTGWYQFGKERFYLKEGQTKVIEWTEETPIQELNS